MKSLIRAEVSAAALRANLTRVREVAPSSRVMAVVKANAYGHGLVPTALCLADADSFAVARIEEALALRGAGVRRPIVLLEGVFNAEQLAEAARQNLEIVVHEAEQLALLESAPRTHRFVVWLKIDTGMNRLGFRPAAAEAAVRRLEGLGDRLHELRLMTHFASADERANRLTQQQLARFDMLTRGRTAQCSLANSAAIFAQPASHADWVRPGLSLYGVSPLGSQAVQDICQRIEKAYQLFFKHNKKGVRPPGFKKVKKYKSFTLKQAGYKFLGGNRVKIGNRVYQFWKSREINGTIKTLTIKRTPLGELFMVVVVYEGSNPEVKFTTSKVAGFDFGLKTFLTCSDGTKIESPEFLKKSLKTVANASRHHSRKLKGSSNRERARKNLVRKYEDISNRRRDGAWKLAHDLTDKFDVLCFETLNLKGMQRLWGRKISDLAFGEFLQIIEWVAKKKKKLVVFIDQWYPSSKTCSHCGHVLEKLDLSVREWRCPSCQSINGRDTNASRNIQMVGASTIGLGDVRQAMPAIAV